MRLASLSLLLLSAIACTNPNWPSLEPNDDPAQNLAQHRERFEDRVGDSYRITYENDCFCPTETRQPVRLTVRNGEITEVIRRSDGVLIPETQWAAYRTVAEIFDAINEGLKEGAREVSVDYNPRFGYPEDVLIDFNLAADAYFGFKVSDLDTLR